VERRHAATLAASTSVRLARVRIFGRKRGEAADIYVSLRRQILDLTADQLGGEASGAPVIALLMETGYPEAVATLVGVVDGSTSLYFSSGGGTIGAGGHADVAAATERWLELSAGVLEHLSPVEDPPLPTQGQTQFVAVTPDGLLSAVAAEDALGDGGHVLSPLFYAGHDVVTQIRLLESTDALR
jgi:hypothetical protein